MEQVLIQQHQDQVFQQVQKQQEQHTMQKHVMKLTYVQVLEVM